jgi:colicin import membrane protein
MKSKLSILLMAFVFALVSTGFAQDDPELGKGKSKSSTSKDKNKKDAPAPKPKPKPKPKQDDDDAPPANVKGKGGSGGRSNSGGGRSNNVNSGTVDKDDTPCGKDDKGRQLYRGPKGGCFYINSNGNKTYVEREDCRC